MVTVTYFFDRVSPDVDNIPKLILDGLKGLVYSDDSQITDMLSRKRSLRGMLGVQSPTNILNEAFGHGREFLYIIVESSPVQEVVA